MKRQLFVLFAVVFMFAACEKGDEFIAENPAPAADEQIEPLSPEEINNRIDQSIIETGDFNWANADAHLIWSAAMHGDSLLTVGYADAAFSIADKAAAESVKDNLIRSIMESEQIAEKQRIVLYEDKQINVFDVRAVDYETVEALLQRKDVRYVEPGAYNYYAHNAYEKSSSGCSFDAANVYTSDYRSIAPNALVSWTYDEHNIPQAWSYSTGAGITVGLIDTGVSPHQTLLGSNFNSGYSSGRSIEKYGTYVDSWWYWVTKTDGPNDKCGHGTSMAATIASPRNDTGMPVGVAYNCNFISYRGTGDVVLNDYHEKKGVANALTALANNPSLRIISMSIGHIFSNNRISDAIEYADYKGKMIIAAGGTSTNFTNWAGVIFPANMDETIAVTGIKSGSSYDECDVCHTGSKIDFTVTMERSWDTDRHSVCLGYYNNTTNYVGGSSVATATTAGIAALIWARNPSWNKAQVLQKMKESADLYPNKSSNFGYGNIDALAAVL